MIYCGVQYDWDAEKAARNFSKHGISFEEAATVFEDALFVIFADPRHSVEEKRFIIIGETKRQKLLMVAYTERGDRIRIISARKATPRERKSYGEQL